MRVECFVEEISERVDVRLLHQGGLSSQVKGEIHEQCHDVVVNALK